MPQSWEYYIFYRDFRVRRQWDATVGADQETPAPSSLSRHRSTVLQWGEICYVSVFRLATDMEGGRKR